MKGGGIIGILGGSLGTALLAKGMKSGGSALLGSLLQTAVGASGGKGSGKGAGGGKSGGVAESLLDAAVSGLSSGKGGGKGAGQGGRGGGSGKGASGRGSGAGSGKGRGKGGRQEDSPLSELLEKTMDALESRAAERREGRAERTTEAEGAVIEMTAAEQGEAEGVAMGSPAPEERPSADERREKALCRIDEATVSAIPGRVRLRHPAFCEPAVQALRSGLLAAGMDEAAFNAKTGSILLTYDAAAMGAPDFLEAVLPLGEFLLDWQG